MSPENRKSNTSFFLESLWPSVKMQLKLVIDLESLEEKLILHGVQQQFYQSLLSGSSRAPPRTSNIFGRSCTIKGPFPELVSLGH